MFIFILLILLIYWLYKNNKKNYIKGGYYFSKKCNYQCPDIKLENKNYIGKLTGNKSDFRDLPNNYYCNEKIRI